jgi:hypothetical protein
MKTVLQVSLYTLVLTPAAVLFAGGDNWPVIRPLAERRVFTDPGQDNMDRPFVSFIRNVDGIPVYKVECHNGNYDDQSEMNFSGDLQCALFAVDGRVRVSGNLLAADTPNEASTDWWNRGSMRSIQLRGECLKYPEYSTTRHFKLRGMILTLGFAEIEWSSGKDQHTDPVMARFTLLVNAVADPTANSSRAEVANGPAPPKSCYP